MAKKPAMQLKVTVDVWELIIDVSDDYSKCNIKCTRDATKEDDAKTVKDGKVTKEFKDVAIEMLSEKGSAPFNVAIQAYIKSLGYMSKEEVDKATQAALDEAIAMLAKEEEDDDSESPESETIHMDVEVEDEDVFEYDDFYEDEDDDIVSSRFNEFCGRGKIGRVSYHHG